MIADEYQVRLLRKSADRIMLVIPDVPESPARLRLQELALDLRREAHELEDAINTPLEVDPRADHSGAGSTRAAHADHLSHIRASVSP